MRNKVKKEEGQEEAEAKLPPPAQSNELANYPCLLLTLMVGDLPPPDGPPGLYRSI